METPPRPPVLSPDLSSLRSNGFHTLGIRAEAGADLPEVLEDVVIMLPSDYQFLQCGSCGCHHAIPLEMYHTKQREGGYWYCPNGHQRGFKTGAEKAAQEAVRRERDQLKQDAARLHERIQEEARRAESAEKKLAASRRRAAAGVCPCCTRTFQNVQRHMKTKHPNVAMLKPETSAS